MRNFLPLAGMLAFATSAFSQTPSSSDPTWAVLDVMDRTLNAVAVQPDKKVVAVTIEYVPYSKLAVVRFNSDGSPDLAFGTGGVVTTTASEGSSYSLALDVAVTRTGKILVAGDYHDYFGNSGFAIVRYLGDGTPDPTFGNEGIVLNLPVGLTNPANFGTPIFRKIAIQPDDKVLLMAEGPEAGNPTFKSLVVVRFNADGHVDQAFGTNGEATIRLANGSSSAQAIQVAPDGSIVIVLNAARATGGAVIRLTPDGRTDTAFGSGGTVNLQVAQNIFATALAIQTDNKIVVGARQWQGTISTNSGEMQVIRLTANGSLDTAFGIGGYSLHDLSARSEYVTSLAIESSGNILVAGNKNVREWVQSEPFLMRLSQSGKLDSKFGAAGMVSVGGFETLDMAFDNADNAYILTSNRYFQFLQEGSYSIRKFITFVAASPVSLPRISSYSSERVFTQSEFAIGIRNSNDALIATVSSTETLGVTGYIFPQDADENFMADIYVVAVTPSGWFMRNPDGVFVPWNTVIASLVPAYRKQRLTDPLAANLFSGKLALPGTYRFYLGYMRNDKPELIYTANAAVVNILP